VETHEQFEYVASVTGMQCLGLGEICVSIKSYGRMIRTPPRGIPAVRILGLPIIILSR